MIRTAGLTAFACLLAATAAWAQPAGRFASGFEDNCPPPLKFAAGACVRECPGGYEDRGRTCEYRNMSNGR